MTDEELKAAGFTGPGIGSEIGGWVGMGLGTEGFNTDPSKYILPQHKLYQGISMQGRNAALGAQAPTIDQSQQAQFRGQQSQLGQMLMQQAQGGGPNPALSQLNQTTDKNIAQSYAMAQAMGGNQAGAARNLANQAGAMRQQAVGDAATMRAQQQLAAQGQLQQLLGGARGQDLGLAGQQAQLNQNQFQLGNQAALGWSNLGLDANKTQLQGNIEQQKIASGAYANQANNSQAAVGGLISGAGAALGLAGGGMVPGYADGGGIGWGQSGPYGVVGTDAPLFSAKPKPKPTPEKEQERYYGVTADVVPTSVADVSPISTEWSPFMESAGSYSPMSVPGFASGGVMNFLGGGGVPGTPAYSGNDARNDTVPAMLSPGEVVLPNSVTQSDDAAERAAAFVRAIQSAKRRKAA